MYAHVKQSGELLTAQGGPGEKWTADGIRASTDKIAAAHRLWSKLGLSGLLLVTGAGNIVRGDELRHNRIAPRVEDVLGRLATLQNTIVLARSLEERNVPVRVFMAPNMKFYDPSLNGLNPEAYDPCAVMEAYARERVVLVAGGTGKDNQSTDAAVLEYGQLQANHTPGEPIIVLKGTKYDGVYDVDPKNNGAARPFSVISAKYMQENYDRFSVVDRKSLQIIRASGIGMRIYMDGRHDLSTVLGPEGHTIGTMVTYDDTIEPIYADY